MSKDIMTEPGTINSSLTPLGICTINVSPGFLEVDVCVLITCCVLFPLKYTDAFFDLYGLTVSVLHLQTKKF